MAVMSSDGAWRVLAGEVPAAGVQVMVDDPQLGEVIVVHHQGVHAYRNSCPHVGVGLDYGDGDCLAEPGVLICSLHGALFAAESGLCTDGPCQGDVLARIPIRVSERGIEVPCTIP